MLLSVRHGGVDCRCHVYTTFCCDLTSWSFIIYKLEHNHCAFLFLTSWCLIYSSGANWDIEKHIILRSEIYWYLYLLCEKYFCTYCVALMAEVQVLVSLLTENILLFICLLGQRRAETEMRGLWYGFVSPWQDLSKWPPGDRLFGKFLPCGD